MDVVEAKILESLVLYLDDDQIFELYQIESNRKHIEKVYESEDFWEQRIRLLSGIDLNVDDIFQLTISFKAFYYFLLKYPFFTKLLKRSILSADLNIIETKTLATFLYHTQDFQLLDGNGTRFAIITSNKLGFFLKELIGPNFVDCARLLLSIPNLAFPYYFAIKDCISYHRAEILKLILSHPSVSKLSKANKIEFLSEASKSASLETLKVLLENPQFTFRDVQSAMFQLIDGDDANKDAYPLLFAAAKTPFFLLKQNIEKILFNNQPTNKITTGQKFLMENVSLDKTTILKMFTAALSIPNNVVQLLAFIDINLKKLRVRDVKQLIAESGRTDLVMK